MKAVRLVAAVMLAMVMLAGLPSAGSAWARDEFLDSSDPAPHQELKRVPGWVTLVFKADADASLATIVVLDDAGQNVATGPLIVEGTNVTTQLQSGLPKGTYTVYYRSTDEFGERRGGAYQFAYGKGSWTTLESEVWKGESAQPTILTDPKPTDPATPSAPATYTPSPTAVGTPTAPPSASGSPSATPRPAPSNGDGFGWLIGGIAAVVLLAGTTGVIWWSRRRA